MEYPFDCISEFIFVETDIEKSDVILIPGSSQFQLMKRAAELYNRGFAKCILPSGGPNSKLPTYESEWEYLKTIGTELGLPDSVILKEDKAQNTFQNAEFSWNLIKEMNMDVKKVIIVCKSYHSRRVLLTYKSIFPSDIKIYISSVMGERQISKDNWFLDKNKSAIVMSEVAKIGLYFQDKILNWV